jgi:RNA polymerase primary sigma factor
MLDSDRRSRALARGLDALGERARRVVELRFGLDGGDERTYDEIGRELGISAWRARHIASRAVLELGRDTELRSLREIA